MPNTFLIKALFFVILIKMGNKQNFCGLCGEFPCEWLVQKVAWRPDVVAELTELANQYRRFETMTIKICIDALFQGHAKRYITQP